MSTDNIRRAEAADLPFLEDMLYEATWGYREDSAAAHPRRELTPADPNYGMFLGGWGRPGDSGLIAMDAQAASIGAAWYRLFDPGNPAYGFVEPSVPVIAIGLMLTHRGQGVGTMLLGALCDLARAEGYRAVSLSVDPENTPAVRLYERCGFGLHAITGSGLTLLRHLVG